MMNDKFIGQWRLQSWKITDSEGQVRSPLGENGKGYIFYMPNNYMSVHLMNPQFIDFKDIPFDQRAKLPEAELEKFLNSYFSYTGKYTIDAHSVYHHVEMCSLPSRIGIVLKRDYQLLDDKLILTAKTELNNKFEDAELIWEKILN